MTTTPTVIPCKRPKVTVDAHPTVAGAHAAICHVPGCDWTYDSVKTACEEAGRLHRAEHRDAVPRIETRHIDDPQRGKRLVDQCQHCGWVTGRGVNTVTDRKASVEHHLSSHHGLVSCP